MSAYKTRVNVIWYTMMVFFASVVINIASLLLPIFTLQIYDRILIHKNTTTLYVLAVGLCFGLLLEVVCRIGRSFITNSIALQKEQEFTEVVLNNFLSNKHDAASTFSVSKKLNILLTIRSLREYDVANIVVLVTDATFLLIFLGFMYYLAGSLALIPAIIIAVLFIRIALFDKAIISLNYEQTCLDEKRYSIIIELLRSLISIKSYGSEKLFKRKYESFQNESTINTYKTIEMNLKLKRAVTSVMKIVIVSMLFVGAYQVISKELSPGVLGACMIIAGRLSYPIFQISSLWITHQRYLDALKTVSEVDEIEQREEHDIIDINETGVIHVRNVEYHADEINHLELKMLNFKVVPGQCLRVKSDDIYSKETFLKLLDGTYQATNGYVKINDCAAYQYDSKNFSKYIGYISYENIIIKGSIYDNIARFQPMRRKEVEDICKYIGLHRVIKKMPNGYQTMLSGTAEDKIGEGVKQLINIARALLEYPKVIIFNHGDRDLDTNGYNHLCKLLYKIKPYVTMVIFTDDVNVSHLADYELDLDQKKIRKVESAHHFEAHKTTMLSGMRLIS